MQGVIAWCSSESARREKLRAASAALFLPSTHLPSMTGERQRIPALGQPRGAGLSLGAARGRSAGRGRPSSSSTSAARDDAAIRSTDNDAVGSRMAAIQHHYIKADPYTPLLYGAAASLSGPLLRPPIINIGTFLRCQAIDNLVDGFLEQGETSQKQIISLGAGSDSRYWRLHADPRKKAKLRHYIELDFKELTSTKVERMLRNKELLKEVASKEDDVRISPDRLSLQSENYSILPCDLRTLPSDSRLTETLLGALDPDVDTLILAECVLAYLSPDSSNALLRHLSSLLHRPFAICYEMCVAGDEQIDADAAPPSKFGTVMLSNLQARSLSMPGARAYSTVRSHATRFDKFLGKDTGSVRRGRAVTLKQVWHGLDDSQRQRLSRLQGLDEIEELEILLSHYAISWFSHDADSIFLHTHLSKCD